MINNSKPRQCFTVFPHHLLRRNPGRGRFTGASRRSGRETTAFRGETPGSRDGAEKKTGLKIGHVFNKYEDGDMMM